MAKIEKPISKGRARLALGMLLLIDLLTFIALDTQDGRLTFSLAASSMAIALLCIDVLLSIGLIPARRWALELARYRCILGVCYLAFLWISFFLLLDHAESIRFSEVATAAATRDAAIGFMLTVTLFIIREQKVPVVPTDAEAAPPTTPEAKADEPAPEASGDASED